MRRLSPTLRAALVPAGLHWFDGDGGKRLAGNA